MKTSVALCTFNGEKFLKEQLDSILSQQLPVDEIVICDDCSTDQTRQILQSYENLHPELFRIFQNEENLGYVRNFEKALTLCTGDIIFLCDQDDVWHAHKTARMLEYFSQHPFVEVASHDLDLIGTDDKHNTFWELKKFGKEEKKYSSDELLKYILTQGNVFPGMSLALRRDILQRYLPLQKVDAILIHDYEIIVKALRDRKFGLMTDILGSYRQHDAQAIGYKEKPLTMTCKLTEIQQCSENYLRLKSYIQAFHLSPKIAEAYRRESNKKYARFLKQFSVTERFFIHLKNKYYYKIIHF